MASEDTVAVRVSHVSKEFRLPHEKIDSIKSLFVNPFRKRGTVEVQHALNDISFEVKKGEFFGIVGRNGSGKSTLLKIIAGIYKPNDGSVQINGRLVPFIELGVGFNPELTGRENVFLNGALMGFSPKEITAKYDAIVAFAELKRFMDQKLKNYSSGMQVRLAFSVATVLAESDILLIDEVLAVGDADFQRKCFEYFRKLKKNKKTVIFVSHDMGAVREYCDRAILINDSKIIHSGTSNEIAKEYTKIFLPDQYENEVNQEKYQEILREKAKNKGKWGTGGIDIQSLAPSKKRYDMNDEEIEISYTIIPAGYTGKIIPGITIKNEKGEPVCGTNSDILTDFTQEVVIGEDRIKTTWKFPNIFNEGRLFIEPAVLADNGETLQWWDDASSFRVVNPEKTPYQVAPKASLEVTS